MRMRSAAELSAARMTSTEIASGFMAAHLDDQTAVVFHRQAVAGVHDRRRARLLHYRRPFDDVARLQIVALEHAKLERVLQQHRIDRARREARGAGCAARERGQTRTLERIDDGEAQVDE